MIQSHDKNLTLLTDLYQLTMGEGYFQTNTHNNESIFHLFYRTPPFDVEYCVAAGLETLINIVKNFSFSQSDITYLSSLKGHGQRPLFSNSYLNYLKGLKINCDIDAVEEGSIIFPKAPMIRVKGPLLQCQLLETVFLNTINFQTLIATKASRIYEVCREEPFLEFGLRRAQGCDGGIHASRASYIGGATATSNTLAGKLFNIPVRGTHAHSWVMSYDDELEAFMSYAKAMPHNCILLVDTYDTIKGVKNAIIVADYLKSIGHELLGIRLDSGDLAKLSIKCREILDEAGYNNVLIVASNDLDELEIKKLKAKGAKIDIWGIGTKLVTSYEKPALGGVYKLSAIKEKGATDFKYKIKTSNDPIKNSIPGILQTRRYFKDNIPISDVIYNCENPPIKSDTKICEDQLIPIFSKGKLVYNSPPIEKIRLKTIRNCEIFRGIKDYKVLLDKTLQVKADQLYQSHKNS